nr:hypothetical protein CFP56_00321 [Quercus suber]
MAERIGCYAVLMLPKTGFDDLTSISLTQLIKHIVKDEGKELKPAVTEKEAEASADERTLSLDGHIIKRIRVEVDVCAIRWCKHLGRKRQQWRAQAYSMRHYAIIMQCGITDEHVGCCTAREDALLRMNNLMVNVDIGASCSLVKACEP